MQWKIEKTEAGDSIQAFLKAQLGPGYSQKQIKRAIEQGACQLNGRIERFSSTRLGAGDLLECSLKLTNDKKQPVQKPLFDINRILFEDSILIAYDKPPGITSEELADLLIKSYDRTLKAVHRLDKDTSGVILFAKGNENKEKLQQLFRKRSVRKTYLAVVDGELKNPSGAVKNYLGKVGAYQGQTLWGEVDAELGLYAETEWKCLKCNSAASLIQCMPKTGRTHQIRVHMMGLGHPILGDYQYAKQFQCLHKPPRLLLHAFSLSLEMPGINKTINIEAPVPADFRQSIDILG